jgi:heat shock protein HslJ
MSVEDVMISNLSRYRWTLISATDSHDQPLDMLMQITDQVRLSLNQYQGQNTLNYSVGCNTISATYQLQGSALTVEDSMSTKMSCGDLNKAEDNLSTLMQGDSELVLAMASNASVDSLKSDTPILTQTTSDAATLVWQGKLTPQARYNSKGEAVFWAVSADMVPCADNNPQMCLRVKPITYNSQGIKTNEGKWRAFIGEIDGYQHDGQHEEVLRLQRYRLDSSGKADDTSNTSDDEYAYVLDAVIESSVVE